MYILDLPSVFYLLLLSRFSLNFLCPYLFRLHYCLHNTTALWHCKGSIQNILIKNTNTHSHLCRILELKAEILSRKEFGVHWGALELPEKALLKHILLFVPPNLWDPWHSKGSRSQTEVSEASPRVIPRPKLHGIIWGVAKGEAKFLRWFLWISWTRTTTFNNGGWSSK